MWWLRSFIWEWKTANGLVNRLCSNPGVTIYLSRNLVGFPLKICLDQVCHLPPTQQQQLFCYKSLTLLTKIFSLWAKLMAICVVWQRTSISSGYLSEIPWVRKRMGYLFCLWRTLRSSQDKNKRRSIVSRSSKQTSQLQDYRGSAGLDLACSCTQSTCKRSIAKCWISLCFHYQDIFWIWTPRLCFTSVQVRLEFNFAENHLKGSLTHSTHADEVRLIKMASVCLHDADVWVKAGEDNAAVPAILQDAGQDDVQEGVHVEVGRQILGPRTILLTQSMAFIPHKLVHG